MRRYGESVQCMCSSIWFRGHFDDDSKVILCLKCNMEFDGYVAGDESRSYGLGWWKEFVGVHGHRPERERLDRIRLVEELLA